jgi:hypothetical protein
MAVQMSWTIAKAEIFSPLLRASATSSAKMPRSKVWSAAITQEGMLSRTESPPQIAMNQSRRLLRIWSVWASNSRWNSCVSGPWARSTRSRAGRRGRRCASFLVTPEIPSSHARPGHPGGAGPGVLGTRPAP